MHDRRTKDTETAIAEIAADNTSGAAEILRRSAAVFSLLKSSEQVSISTEQARRTIIETCVALAKAQPDMSSLVRLASETVSSLINEGGACVQSSAAEVFRAAVDAAGKFVESAIASAQAAAMHSVNLIGDGSTVLTHSRSSTVFDALIATRRAGKTFEVIATESRPMFEGRSLASELVARGINVMLIADAAASLFIERADIVLVGADRITPEHAVNKIGTRMIALAARERGVPIYAICDMSKFIATDYLLDVKRDQANANELWPNAPEGVVVVNRYFESTPLAYFTGVVSERGLLSGTQASAHAREVFIDPILIDALQSRRKRDQMTESTIIWAENE